jgi:hypothetical protein
MGTAIRGTWTGGGPKTKADTPTSGTSQCISGVICTSRMASWGMSRQVPVSVAMETQHDWRRPHRYRFFRRFPHSDTYRPSGSAVPGARKDWTENRVLTVGSADWHEYRARILEMSQHQPICREWPDPATRSGRLTFSESALDGDVSATRQTSVAGATPG